MRMLLTARLDTTMSNQAVTDGTMSKMVQEMVEQLRPESAYFTAEEGDRCCYMVFDMKESSQIPPACEPFFHAGAKLSLRPVMTVDDLQTGLASLGG
ncbi:hypothetical protein [Actinacidiphila bryophytorum]|uniref:Uncharacterized protein n=1 Tax=Actinacidiphila bryophytorum TaxID=1436133 RepID=A0A9W4H4L7_9ACTN|nr:hypothetical protein [Actinacidiphila bryophytorum]MBM9437267.1 hypothetical protein [Actinacidiphila bryophytorum]MBN6541787.1 hypothetical protein [Actinacidiphila bryophytorum]CAG7651357.1 conserved hypothetical protein [Actinacidiphila bryophytorum]